MSFSKKILSIFGFLLILLVAFSLTALVIVHRLGSGSEELIEDKMLVFSQISNAVKVSKEVEAEGAHVLISGSVEDYNRFNEVHSRFHSTLQDLLKDQKLQKFQGELEEISVLERKAQALGAPFFEARVFKKNSLQNTARSLSATGLPVLMETQERLKKLEKSSLESWQEASRSLQSLQMRFRDVMKWSFVLITLLTVFLMGSLWAILRQRHLLDERQNRILEKELAISNARKEAVEIVAHDLRNPLSSIRMCLELLKTADENEREMFSQIGRNSANAAMKIVEQILDHTKIELDQLVLEKSSCDMKAFLAEQGSIFKTLCMGKNIEFIMNIDEKISNCMCDDTRIGQVLSNLVGNALKFSESGREIQMNAYLKQGELCVEIRDQGPGLSKSQKERIFDRYWQSPERRKGGLGLGLSIAKAVVTAHGGRIWVDSEPGRGSVFCFTLPSETNANSGAERRV